MMHLIFRLVLPLSIISFAAITKWWYVLPVDAPDTMLAGFPFPFVGEGWHTSMSLQIFVTELVIDFLTYFSFWLLLVFCVNRFVIKIQPFKMATIMLWIFTGLIISGAAFIASDSNNIFYAKRPFEFETLKTGCKFTWQETLRPDYNKFQLDVKTE